jgi:hypothetical protein
MNRAITWILIVLCLMSFVLCMKVLISSVENAGKHQFKENSKTFAIDSVDYHAPGRDNTLQVSPYWKCHLKGTNVWVHVNENKEVGDSLSMIIKH